MSDPTPPARRGRHASPDSPSGVPASAWLASMPNRPPVGDDGQPIRIEVKASNDIVS